MRDLSATAPAGRCNTDMREPRMAASYRDYITVA